MPTATDLVTDLPADFEVFGQAVDTDFAGLLGGTTGQVLAKASGTDLDFVWSADAAGIVSGNNFVSSAESTTSDSFVGLTTSAKAALLDKLGITSEEASLLLS
jgi:hypothetical protein